ncbi:ABC transporter substrate-binding protein [Desulfonatronum lacustre]|uniref:ABC transporter substrate-binding protein n=1 Tax=Desulfonatronum lacustre TaxID=66849 RepID=UPI00048C72B6|nr:ABC transporter substrate-binding protein [Desulfonatronum lacustre]
MFGRFFMIGMKVMCILVALSSSVSFAQDSATEFDRPVIGVILPFSSAFEDIAFEQQRAINLALSKSDVPVNVIFKDGGADKESAVQAFHELAGLEDRPLAVISCSSWASDAIHPLAAEKGIFHIAIGSAALNRTHSGNTVRFTLDAADEQQQLAEYLSSFEKIAILAMDNDLGKSWISHIRHSFSEQVAATHVYDPQQMDIHEKLSEIQSIDPDILVLISAGEAAGIARQARKIGITAQFVGTRPIERAELLAEPEYTNGLVYTYPSYNTKHEFSAMYRGEYGSDPGFFGVEAFDAVTTLLQILDKGLVRPADLFQSYAGRKFVGALGEIYFTSHGDARYPYLFKQIVDGRFQVAGFQFPMLLEKTSQQLEDIFQEMDQDIALAARKLSKTGLAGEPAASILQELYAKNPHAYNCVTVDAEGIIVNVAPDRYLDVIGEDISQQEQIVRLHSTRQPVLSQAVKMVEGFVGIDLEHPVFNLENEFIGSVSILAKPDFFGSIISQKVSNFPVEMFVIQKDGVMVYDINEQEIGKNVFLDPLYQTYPSLLAVARRIAAEPDGRGRYRFLDKNMQEEVVKNIVWTTVGLHGTEYRLALAFEE